MSSSTANLLFLGDELSEAYGVARALLLERGRARAQVGPDGTPSAGAPTLAQVIEFNTNHIHHGDGGEVEVFLFPEDTCIPVKTRYFECSVRLAIGAFSTPGTCTDVRDRAEYDEIPSEGGSNDGAHAAGRDVSTKRDDSATLQYTPHGVVVVSRMPSMPGAWTKLIASGNPETVTERDRNLLTQQQRQAANEALTRVSLFLHDNTYCLMPPAANEIPMAKDGKTIDYATLNARDPVQMRALVLFLDPSLASENLVGGIAETTVLNAWQDVAFGHHYELVDVPRPAFPDGPSPAASRLRELLYETDWPAALRSAEAAYRESQENDAAIKACRAELLARERDAEEMRNKLNAGVFLVVDDHLIKGDVTLMNLARHYCHAAGLFTRIYDGYSERDKIAFFLRRPPTKMIYYAPVNEEWLSVRVVKLSDFCCDSFQLEVKPLASIVFLSVATERSLDGFSESCKKVTSPIMVAEIDENLRMITVPPNSDASFSDSLALAMQESTEAIKAHLNVNNDEDAYVFPVFENILAIHFGEEPTTFYDNGSLYNIQDGALGWAAVSDCLATLLTIALCNEATGAEYYKKRGYSAPLLGASSSSRPTPANRALILLADADAISFWQHHFDKVPGGLDRGRICLGMPHGTCVSEYSPCPETYCRGPLEKGRYFTAPDVRVDVLSASDLMRCLFRRQWLDGQGASEKEHPKADAPHTLFQHYYSLIIGISGGEKNAQPLAKFMSDHVFYYFSAPNATQKAIMGEAPERQVLLYLPLATDPSYYVCGPTFLNDEKHNLSRFVEVMNEDEVKQRQGCDDRDQTLRTIVLEAFDRAPWRTAETEADKEKKLKAEEEQMRRELYRAEAKKKDEAVQQKKKAAMAKSTEPLPVEKEDGLPLFLRKPVISCDPPPYMRYSSEEHRTVILHAHSLLAVGRIESIIDAEDWHFRRTVKDLRKSDQYFRLGRFIDAATLGIEINRVRDEATKFRKKDDACRGVNHYRRFIMHDLERQAAVLSEAIGQVTMDHIEDEEEAADTKTKK